MASKADRGYTLRAVSTVIGFWFGIAVLAVVIVAPIFLGEWRVLGFAAAPVLLLAWLLWLVLYRPSVRYDARMAVVVNIGRVHLLPWSRVTDVEQRLNLVFHLDQGKPLNAWGAPFPRRPGNIERGLDRRTRPSYDFGRNAETLEGFRRAAAPTDEPVVTRWDTIPLVIGGVLIVAVAVEIVLGI